VPSGTLGLTLGLTLPHLLPLRLLRPAPGFRLLLRARACFRARLGDLGPSQCEGCGLCLGLGLGVCLYRMLGRAPTSGPAGTPSAVCEPVRSGRGASSVLASLVLGFSTAQSVLK
jgi:hypothetical protein